MAIKSIISANTKPGKKRIQATKADIFYLLLDNNPQEDVGVAAPLGSIAAVPFADGYVIYYKWGPLDTDWKPMIDKIHQIEFIGKSTGPNKTTTVSDGPTIAEIFGVNNELWFRWGIPSNFIPNEDLKIKIYFYINTSETGKLASFELDIGASDSIPLNTTIGTESAIDVPISGNYVDNSAEFLLLHSKYPAVDYNSLNFKLTRIESSNDPTADIRVHLVTIEVID